MPIVLSRNILEEFSFLVSRGLTAPTEERTRRTIEAVTKVLQLLVDRITKAIARPGVTATLLNSERDQWQVEATASLDQIKNRDLASLQRDLEAYRRGMLDVPSGNPKRQELILQELKQMESGDVNALVTATDDADVLGALRTLVDVRQAVGKRDMIFSQQSGREQISGSTLLESAILAFNKRRRPDDAATLAALERGVSDVKFVIGAAREHVLQVGTYLVGA